MTTLSEAASKELLASYGLPISDERLAAEADGAVAAAREIGFPCVVKLCGQAIAHKTERNLVRLGLADAAAVERAAQDLLDQARDEDGPVELLVAPMINATREFIVGADRSADFGPVVMIGIGGIFAEAMEDVVFRLLPASPATIDDMLDELATQKLLGPFRGEPEVDRVALVGVVQSVAAAMIERDDIASIDVNPVMIAEGTPIAVDALVALR